MSFVIVLIIYYYFREEVEWWVGEVEARLHIARDLLEEATKRFMASRDHEFVRHILRVFVQSSNCLMLGMAVCNEKKCFDEKFLNNLNETLNVLFNDGMGLIDHWCGKALCLSRSAVRTYPTIEMSDPHELKVCDALNFELLME